MSDLVTRLGAIESRLSVDVLERPREIHAALNALVSRKHFFMLGPPGTAKSFLIRRLTDRIDFTAETNADEALFQWLLTRYTTPEEVFGPPSLADLEQGRYKRNTTRKLPRSSVAFLDEIFKANSSILNALLTIMNERLFNNGEDNEHVPLSSIFAASNEMPQDDGLWALWDRLHFRFSIKPLQDSGNFVKMLSAQREVVPEKLVTWSEVLVAQKEAAQVTLTSDIYDAMKLLRDLLRAQGVEPTERRFFECLDIIRAEAWLGGKTVAEIDDMRILRHVLWGREEDIKTVERIILELANPLDKEAAELLERVEGLEADLQKAIAESDGSKELGKRAVEIYSKLTKLKNLIGDLETRCQNAGRKSEEMDHLQERFKSVASRLYNDAFGVSGTPNI